MTSALLLLSYWHHRGSILGLPHQPVRREDFKNLQVQLPRLHSSLENDGLDEGESPQTAFPKLLAGRNGSFQEKLIRFSDLRHLQRGELGDEWIPWWTSQWVFLCCLWDHISCSFQLFPPTQKTQCKTSYCPHCTAGRCPERKTGPANRAEDDTRHHQLSENKRPKLVPAQTREEWRDPAHIHQQTPELGAAESWNYYYYYHKWQF